MVLKTQQQNFPSFSEGLSLRVTSITTSLIHQNNFPSFSEGLSLRDNYSSTLLHGNARFPFLFGGTFIEGEYYEGQDVVIGIISLPFRRDFH